MVIWILNLLFYISWFHLNIRFFSSRILKQIAKLAWRHCRLIQEAGNLARNSRVKITPREKFLSPCRVSPFLAWGDFHVRSRFARSTIPEEKWGTTRSLAPLWLLTGCSAYRSSNSFFLWTFVCISVCI